MPEEQAPYAALSDESHADFCERVGAVCEAAPQGKWLKVIDYGAGHVSSLRCHLTDEGHVLRALAFIETALVALPEALRRLESMEAALEGMVEQHGFMQARALEAEAKRDRLRAEVKRLRRYAAGEPQGHD